MAGKNGSALTNIGNRQLSSSSIMVDENVFKSCEVFSEMTHKETKNKGSRRPLATISVDVGSKVEQDAKQNKVACGDKENLIQGEKCQLEGLIDKIKIQALGDKKKNEKRQEKQVEKVEVKKGLSETSEMAAALVEKKEVVVVESKVVEKKDVVESKAVEKKVEEKVLVEVKSKVTEKDAEVTKKVDKEIKKDETEDMIIIEDEKSVEKCLKKADVDQENRPPSVELMEEEDLSQMSIESEASEPNDDEWCFDRLLTLPEYENDIHIYLLKRQTEIRPIPNYMIKHKNEINSKMRTILVDWMVEVAEEYQMTSETLFLAVNLVDRFLSIMGITRAKLQLLGVTALFTASKYEEIYPPDISDFVYVTDYAFTKNQILEMEKKVLEILEFEISVPTIHYFLRKHLSSMGMGNGFPTKVGLMAQYLCYLALIKCDPCTVYLPNDIAVSAILVAANLFGLTITIDGETWRAFYPGLSQTQLQSHLIELQSCIDTLHELKDQAANDKLLESENPPRAVYLKFSQKKYSFVAEERFGSKKPAPKLIN